LDYRCGHYFTYFRGYGFLAKLIFNCVNVNGVKYADDHALFMFSDVIHDVIISKTNEANVVHH
jgi:hypothetical protein